MLTFRTEGFSGLFGVIIGVHVMEDSPKSVRAVLLEPERVLSIFLEIARESGGEIGAPDA